MWVLICEATTCSRIFDRKGRFEMERKFEVTLGSRPGCLSIGFTAASFRDSGTEPEVRED